MPKNIAQTTYRTTAPNTSIIAIGYPDGANPYGYSDSYITKENFLKEITTLINNLDTDNEINASAITTLEQSVGSVDSFDATSDYLYTLEDGYELEKIIAKWISGTPIIGVEYDGNEIIPEQGMTESSNLGKQLVMDIEQCNFTGSSVQINIKISGGGARFYVQVKNRGF